MKIILTLLVAMILVGCATSTYNVGREFSSENVQLIEHGVTTKAEMLSLFGEPYTKAVISANQEKWIYTHSAGSAKAQSYIVTMKVKSEGTYKMLDVLLEDGVVVNHTFTDGPNPYSVNVN